MIVQAQTSADLHALADFAARNVFSSLSQRANDGSEALFVAYTGNVIRSASDAADSHWADARNAIMRADLSRDTVASVAALRSALLESVNHVEAL